MDMNSIYIPRTPNMDILGHQVGSGFVCGDCGRTYKLKSSLRNHRKWECGKEPQFKCIYCNYKAKQKMHMVRHMVRMHKDVDPGVSGMQNNDISEKSMQSKLENFAADPKELEKKKYKMSGGILVNLQNVDHDKRN